MGPLVSEKEMLKDIHYLLGEWFCALEDEGGVPFEIETCIKFMKKYNYTENDYKGFLKNIN